MLILRDHSAVDLIADPDLRALVALRYRQLHSPDDPDAPDATGHFIVVEPGDTVEQLEQSVGLPILHGLFDDLPFGHPDFFPCSEILEEHRNESTCIYEMVFISNDDGAATAIFVADTEGIDADLLALCRSFATPAVTSP